MAAPSEPVEDTHRTVTWSGRYAQYLAASGRRAARNAELTRALMRRLARGEVSPTVAETAHLAFLSGNAMQMADQLADATSAFLVGLVDAQDGYTAQLLASVEPGLVAGTGDTRPRLVHADWADWLERLDDYLVQRNDARVTALRAALHGDRAGSSDGQEAGSDAAASHRQPSGAGPAAAPLGIGSVMELYLTLLDRLDEIHNEYTTGYLENVLGLIREPTPTGEALHLVAPAGETATARFAVANNGTESVRVRSVLTDVRRCDGVGPAFDIDATVTPDNFVLPAGSEEILTVSVPLLQGQFSVGPEYEGTLRVLGPAASLVELPLRVRAAQVAEPTAGHL